jgi:glycosyltransferase involved in cell wall biosynthesis
LLKALIVIDNENDYRFFVDKDTALENVFPEGVNLVVVPTSVSPTQAASDSGRRSFRDLWAMTREVRRHDLDLFFFPAVYSYYPILNRTTIIITIHDMIPELHPEAVFPNRKLRLFWRMKRRLAIRQANLILTVSDNSKREIVNLCNVAESKVNVISEAANSAFRVLPQDSDMSTMLKHFDLDTEDRFLLYVGGISPHKNLRLLVNVYSELLEDPGYSDMKLVLVGDYKGDSFYSDYSVLTNQINKLNIENKVIFTGYVEDKDLAYLYNAASLLVFPSLQEGFGLPAVEAMVCGCPVAASNLGSLPEIVSDAGLLFDPYSKEEVLAVIKQVLSDDDLRNEMRLRGLERAKQFSWEKAAKDLLTIFDNLVNGAP